MTHNNTTMERRKFFVTTTSAFLGSTFLSKKSKSAVAVDFNLKPVPDYRPSNVDSVSIQFDNFHLIPQYLDNSSNLNLEFRLEIPDLNLNDHIVASSIPFENGQVIDRETIYKSTGTDINNIIIDPLESDSTSLFCHFKVIVKHDDIGEEEYDRYFTISKKSKTIENFEDGTVSNYKNRKGNGLSAVTSNVFEGTYAARESFSGIRYSSNTDPDLQGPERGDKIEFYFRTNNSNTQTSYGLLFAVQDTSNFGGGYFFRVSPNDNSIILLKDGRSTNLASSEWTPTYNEYLKGVVEFGSVNSNDITVRVENLSGKTLASATEQGETTYDSGGLGYIANDKGSKADWTIDSIQTS